MTLNHSILVILLFTSLSLTASAQVTFQAIYRSDSAQQGEANAIVYTQDGGYVVAGKLQFGFDRMFDITLTKVDSIGNVVWNNVYGGKGIDIANVLVQTRDNGFLIAGITKSFGEGLNEIYVIRTDNRGKHLWSKTYGGEKDEIVQGMRILPDGGFILAGRTNSYGAGNIDAFLIRCDAEGNALWGQTYGGPLADQAIDVAPTIDGGFILAGSTTSYGLESTDKDVDLYLVKVTSTGKVEWSRTYASEATDAAYCIAETEDKGFIIAGATGSTPDGAYDMLLIKTDRLGNMDWARTYGGTSNEWAFSLQQDGGHGFILAGYSESFKEFGQHAYVVSTDSIGTLRWSRTYGPGVIDRFHQILMADSRELIMCGTTSGSDSTTSGLYIVRTNMKGESGCNDGIVATRVATPVLETRTEIETLQESDVEFSSAATISGPLALTTTIVCRDIPPTSTLAPSNNRMDIAIISPNPVPSGRPVIFALGNIGGAADISVVDMTGNVVLELSIPEVVQYAPGSSRFTIETSDMPKGAYIVRISTPKGEQVEKLIVQ